MQEIVADLLLTFEKNKDEKSKASSSTSFEDTIWFNIYKPLKRYPQISPILSTLLATVFDEPLIHLFFGKSIFPPNVEGLYKICSTANKD